MGQLWLGAVNEFSSSSTLPFWNGIPKFKKNKTKKRYPQSVSVSMLCLFWGRSLAGFSLSIWGVGSEQSRHLVKWSFFFFVGELAKLSVSWMNENGVCFRILCSGLRDFGMFRYALLIYAFFWNTDCVIMLMDLKVGEFP